MWEGRAISAQFQWVRSAPAAHAARRIVPAVARWVLVSSPGGQPEEVAVRFHDGHRVEALVGALAAFLGDRRELELTRADGTPIDRMARVVDAAIRPGEQLTIAPRGRYVNRAPETPLELRVVGGALGGVRLPLAPGTHSLGRSSDCDLRLLDPTVSRSPIGLTVREDRVIADSVDPRHALRLHGRAVVPGGVLAVGDVFEVGGALLTIAPTRAGRPLRAVDGAWTPRVLRLPPLPPDLENGRAGGDGRRLRRAVGMYRAAAEQSIAQLPALIAEERLATRAAAPDACEVADRCRLHEPTVWERTPESAAFLTLRVGWGDLPSRTRVEDPPGAGAEVVARIRGELLPAPPVLHDVPISVDLRRARTLGIRGPAQLQAGAVRWLVVQAATHHAPGALRIAALVADETPWSWLKWLPHTAFGATASGPRMVAGPSDARRVVSAMSAVIDERMSLPEPAGAGREAILLVLEEGCPGADALLERAARAAGAGIHVIAFGEGAAARAAAARVELAPLELQLVSSEGSFTGVPDQIGAGLAAQIARDLAARIETSAGAAPLLEAEAAREVPDASLRARWDGDAAGLGAVLGAGGAGPVEVDLRSGPHTVVVGSREAGRSRLLAALIGSLAFRHSPRRLQLLIAGAGADPDLALLRDLPHAAACHRATPEPSIEDALSTLTAQVAWRAKLLSDAGRARMDDLEREEPAKAPARLVAVLDGFDRLAHSGSEIEARVASLAEQSRDLGVHLVLTTRRDPAELPAGLRKHARLRLALAWGADGGDAARASVSADDRPIDTFRVADVDAEGLDAAGGVAVDRLGFAGPAGGGALTRLVGAARAVAPGDTRPDGQPEGRTLAVVVASPPGVAAAAAADGPAPGPAAVSEGGGRLGLKLTVEVPPGAPEDVSIDFDRGATVSDLIAAVAAALGLSAGEGASAYVVRRQVRLRPDQTLASARLRVADRVVITSGPPPAPAAPAADPGSELDSRVDVNGVVAFNRPPRDVTPPPELAVRVGAPPDRGQTSWKSMMPVMTGVVMGLGMGAVTFLNSGGRVGLILLSAAMTPAMALMTGFIPLQDLVAKRRAFRRGAADFRSRLQLVGGELSTLRAREAAYLRDAAPDGQALTERVHTLETTLWERGPDSDDWLHLRVGLQQVASRAGVALAPGGDAELRAEAEAATATAAGSIEVPMVVPLDDVGALGLHGERTGVAALARWLVVQAAVLHSPEDLVIASALPAADRPGWDWLKWLPHVHSEAAQLPGQRVVTGPPAAKALLQRLLDLLDDRVAAAAGAAGRPGERPPAAVIAVLHEDTELPRGQVSRLLAQGPRFGLHAVWIAARARDIPGQCQADVGVEVVDGVARPEMRRKGAGRAERGTRCDQMPVDVAAETARGLAPLRDIGARAPRVGLPESVSLFDVLHAGGSLEALVLAGRTRQSTEEDRLDAAMGIRGDGSDFRIDLRADGPHVLVAGPAGSGKSELLRTLVGSLAARWSPDDVSFLLVDPEDQRTFRECARLPHTASVVSYLDGNGVKRVLTALEAEVNGREGILRATGSPDIATVRRSRPELCPPSLVLVVDGTDQLANDQREFVDGLVNLGRQGSRLGIHLVIACRRPSSLPEALRDAANLTVLLRMSDDAAGRDSVARGRGSLPPGRALARGTLEPMTAEVQVAYAGGHTGAHDVPRAVVVRELDFDGTPVARHPARVADAAGEVDIVRLVRAIEAVHGGPARPPRGPRVLQELLEEGVDGPPGAAAGAEGAAGRRRTGQPAASIALTDLLRIPDVATFDIPAAWHPRPIGERLRVPIGLDSLGRPMMADLKEAAAGGSGPHGLLIGTSGSGKSEALRTLVASLALTHPPDVLAFVFIDFKGGAAFAELSELPHAAGMITNLGDDLSLIDRMQAAITGERNRRQEMLRRAGNVDKVSEYQRLRESGANLEPLPYLLVIVDEFGELLSVRPDFVDLFAMIGRVGRSLGMHLLFSSQQFEEGRLRGLEDNLGYRIALRTASPQASRTVLGVPDAFELPKEPGWGYFKSGPSDIVRFRAAQVSQPYDAPGGSAAERDAAGPTTVGVFVERMRAAAAPVHRIWLDPLQVGITLDGVLGSLAVAQDRGLVATGWAAHGQLQVPIGRVDKPIEQKQDVMAADLTGHLMVIGASQTGKSTLLRTLLAGAALTHTPREAQFYCLDFSGGALRSAADLPHVGGVTGREDPERVRRTVEELVALVVRRERLFQELSIDSAQVMRARRDAAGEDLADVFLVVDNWNGLRQEFGELEDAIRDVIVARGPGYGVHLVITANRSLEVRDAIRNGIGGRIELRLTEPAETLIEPRAAAKSLRDASEQYEARMKERRERDGVAPDFEKLHGRGILPGGLQFQAALPRVDGERRVIDLQGAFERLAGACRAAWTGAPAPAIRVLPRMVRRDELPQAGREEPPGVPMGILEADLGTYHLDLVGGDPHFMVVGDVESGKSTFLRTFVSGLMERSTAATAQVLVIDYKRSLIGTVPPDRLLSYCTSESVAKGCVTDLAAVMGRRLPGPDVAVEDMAGRSWWKSRAEVYVVVDDYDLVASSTGNPLQPLLAYLPQSRDVALHLVVARSSGGVMTGLGEAVLRRLRDLRSPALLLSGDPGEGVVMGGFRLTPLVPGRGRLLRKREPATFLQVAL